MAEQKQNRAHAETRRRGEKATENGLPSPVDGWRMMPLREAYRFTSKPRGMKTEKGTTVPFLPMDQIPIGRVTVSTYEERPAESITSGTYIENGDLLVAKITPSFENGKQAIVNWDRPFGYATTEVIPIQEVKGISDKRYLFHILLHPEIRSALAGKMDGTTGRQRLSKETLGSCVIPVPPLTTQREIAAILGQVQKAIEEQERLLALTAELKRTLLHRLFTQGLRGEPQKQTDIGPVPESWELVPLSALAKIGNGSTPKRDNQAYWQGGHIPWLNSARIHDRFINEPDQFVTDLAVKACHLPRVKANSLLIAITGQGKTLGNSALVEFETCINQHLAYAQFTTPKVLPAFVLWYMQTRYDHLRSISQAGGSTKGALTCGYLKTYPIPIPLLDEQKDIVTVFSALEVREKFCQRKHATLSDLFRTLLHQLMTGQIMETNYCPMRMR